MANMQAQTEANMQAQQAKDQSAAALMEKEGSMKMQEEALRGNVKDSLLTKEFNMEVLRQLMAGADAEAGLTTTKTSSK